METGQPKPLNLRTREVQAAIDRAQHQRQVLIIAIQWLFALNIGLVYQSTAALTPGDLAKNPTSMLFALYGLFTFWVLYRSQHRRLHWADITVSIILDYALCLQVMFYQHEMWLLTDLDMPQAPMFSYVYLFIAIRCLHFRPVYVMFAGFLACVTWALLIVITKSGAGNGFLGNLTGNTLLEAMMSGVVDKLLSIIAVTVTLIAAIHEAKKHFEASIVRAVAGAGLARFVSEAVAHEVLFNDESLEPGQGRHQTVAILMMDIRNFTNHALNADPSEAMALLQEYQSLMEPVIIQHGGCIDKFMGDGILAHFGALNMHPRFAAEAMTCVEHLIHTTETWNEKRVAAGLKALEFGVACHIGEAVVGLVGGATKVEFTIIGDPVNVTAKLEKHTKTVSARAITTASAFETAQRQGFVPVYPGRRLKASRIAGLDQPMDLVVLCDRMARAAPPPPPENEVKAVPA